MMGLLERSFGTSKKMGIYAIVNLVDGKQYVGSSMNIKKRSRDHLWFLRNDRHPNPYLQNAFNKYGESSFEFRILEEVVSEEELLAAEQYWLDYTQCYDREHGYNIDFAADRKVFAPETRAKISAANTGRVHTAESRARMSAAQKGRFVSDEARVKLRAANLGKTMTVEACAKIAKAKLVMTPNQVHEVRRRVVTGDSLSSLARSYGVSKETIRNIIRGRTWGHLAAEEGMPVISAINRGRPLSDETRKKLSAVRKGHPVSEETRRKIAEGMAALTPAQVQEIRRRASAGESYTSIARIYGVHRTTISRIIKGKRWPHLPEE
jgi:group I intron endonuclease